ncbi:DUF4406 domain-containing protein [Breoghania sp.]|uniref:DUF4406 domain-containing protein n=1 Tax=Breoghania sp. TaxID=2065378 RepID=UPI002AA6AEDE|nr:DUF4406 domain-containing protein [Breoghania sp.]
MIKSVYLSGPMTGIQGFNYPAFNSAAAQLRAAGIRVCSPAEYPHDGPLEDFPIRDAFASYCDFICYAADAVVLLDGWETSDGARVEKALADRIGVPTITLAAALSGGGIDIIKPVGFGNDGVARIAAERSRHLSKEGFTPEKDARHRFGEMAAAAACYALICSGRAAYSNVAPIARATVEFWPWDSAWWKPSADSRRNLEKAGALIAAEIDRLDRLEFNS